MEFEPTGTHREKVIVIHKSRLCASEDAEKGQDEGHKGAEQRENGNELHCEALQ